MEAVELQLAARNADQMMTDGRAMLVSAVREARAAGMSEREIGVLVGRSQPEVHRLLHFHGTSPNSRALRKARREILQILDESGLTRPRVFGSTARGEDSEGSDIDLLVTAREPLGYMAQAKLALVLTDVVGVPVDVVFENGIKPELEERIRSEAVPL